jgi:hypothetical protein
MDPPSNWNGLAWSGAQLSTTNSVTINTTDGSQIKAEDYEAAMKSPSSNLPAFVSGSGSSAGKYPMAPTTAGYLLKNCDRQGNVTNVWTGQYCASVSLAYRDAIDKAGSGNLTKVSADLGLIAQPPKPSCESVKVLGTISRGSPVKLDITASGVVTGYRVAVTVDETNFKFPDFKPATSGPVYTNANQIAVTKSIGEIAIPTSGYTAAQLPANADLTIEAAITGVNGEEVLCPVLRNVPVGTPTCEIAIYDDQIYNSERVGVLIGKPHQNRELYIAIKMSGAAGYLGRITLSGVTPYVTPFGGDALGLVVPTDGSRQPSPPVGSPSGWYMYKAVIQGTAGGEYGIVGHILDPVTKERAGSCVRTGDMAGQWIPSPGSTNCAQVCTGQGMVKTFDRGGMSCLSGENFYNRAYGAKMRRANDVRAYYAANGFFIMVADMNSIMGSTWGGNGDYEEDNLVRPDLDKTTVNEGPWCYWLSRKTTYAQCAGTTNNPWTPGACQKFDNDGTDYVKACYCKKP